MAKEVAKIDTDFGMDDSMMDMMMPMMMMIMMMVLVQSLPALTQGAEAQTQALEAQAYGGEEDPRTIHATGLLSWINLIYDYPFKPWVSVFIINDGPSAVEIGINYPDDRFTMQPRETRTITRTGAEERIKIMYFKCFPGVDSTLRVTGVY